MADLSVSNFPNTVTVPANTDLFYISDDLGGGSFESKKITWASIIAAIPSGGDGIYGGSGALSAATTVTMGSNNLSFTGTGSVGVGITPSSARFHVRGIDNISTVARFQNNAGYNILQIDGDSHVFMDVPGDFGRFGVNTNNPRYAIDVNLKGDSATLLNSVSGQSVVSIQNKNSTVNNWSVMQFRPSNGNTNAEIAVRNRSSDQGDIWMVPSFSSGTFNVGKPDTGPIFTASLAGTDFIKCYRVFATSSTATFSDGDLTPSVDSGNNFKTSNTGSTLITNFDNGIDGQTLVIVFGDANTTIQDSTNIQLQGGANFTAAANNTLVLYNDGTAWFELTRSIN